MSVDGPVFRGDGIQLFGFDAELERKAQEKRRHPDAKKEEMELLDWVRRASGNDSVRTTPIDDTDEPVSSLDDGLALCQLLNRIRPGTVLKYNTEKLGHVKKQDNLKIYAGGCGKLNVECFIPSDLLTKKNISAVFQNLRAVARFAVNDMNYDGPTPPVKANRARSATVGRNWSQKVSAATFADSPSSTPTTSPSSSYISVSRSQSFAPAASSLSSSESTPAAATPEVVAIPQKKPFTSYTTKPAHGILFYIIYPIVTFLYVHFFVWWLCSPIPNSLVL